MDSHLGKAVWVHAWLPTNATEPLHAGTLRFDSERAQYAFIYETDYLAHPSAYSLAPSLPLGDAVYYPPLDPTTAASDDEARERALDPVFRNAAPDSFGRSIVDEEFHRTNLDEITYLLEPGHENFGSLSFTPAGHELPKLSWPIDDSRDERTIQALAMMRDPDPDDLNALLDRVTVGGAWPKFARGSEIIKTSFAGDAWPRLRLEYFATELARAMGVNTHHVQLGRLNNRDVLAVSRFDRSSYQNPSDALTGKRRQALSFWALAQVDEMVAHRLSYPNFLRIIEPLAIDPQAQGEELFRRIAANIIVGNTDDHARNHACFWDGAHLELTPAYDIEARLSGTAWPHQALAYGEDGERESDLDVLASCAETYGMTVRHAKALISDMLDAAHDAFTDLAEQAYLTPEQAQKGMAVQIL